MHIFGLHRLLEGHSEEQTSFISVTTPTTWWWFARCVCCLRHVNQIVTLCDCALQCVADGIFHQPHVKGLNKAWIGSYPRNHICVVSAMFSSNIFNMCAPVCPPMLPCRFMLLITQVQYQCQAVCPSIISGLWHIKPTVVPWKMTLIILLVLLSSSTWQCHLFHFTK